MRKVNALTLILMLALAGAACAACPDVIGIWSSVPDGNPDYYPLLNGRVSEAWCNGVAGDPGNVQNAMSWDGASAELGLEWKIWDMAINAAGPFVVFDGVSGGNGVRIFQTGYDGGQFWLGGSGNWTDGDLELYGAIQDYLVVSTVTYSGGNVVAAVSNITFRGVFEDCPEVNECVIDFAIANAALVWRDGYTWPMPASYPAFLCGDSGELFATSDITLGIDCAIATEAHSWSEIKSRFE